MKILVVGAGVGGVACALGLLESGHQVEIFEQGEQLRASGNGVILWPNGTGILRDLGVSLDGLGTRMDTVHTNTSDGFSLARIELAKVVEQYGAPCTLVSRGHLLERMGGLLPPGCLKLGRRCVGIKQRGTGSSSSVVVILADGSEVEGDVLIGADGHRSAVRKHLFGHEPAAYTGWASWHGITAPGLDVANGHDVYSYYSSDGLCGLHPVGKGLVHWVFETPWRDGQLMPPLPGAEADDDETDVSLVARLAARFGSWASPVPELLETITDEDISLFPHIIHRVPKWWGRDRVTLAGDAVHALPPRSAMGINQALEDAWALKRALARPGDPAMSLRAYEGVRRPRVAKQASRAAFLERANRSKAIDFALWLARKGITLPSGTGRLGIKAGSNYLNNDLP